VRERGGGGDGLVGKTGVKKKITGNTDLVTLGVGKKGAQRRGAARGARHACLCPYIEKTGVCVLKNGENGDPKKTRGREKQPLYGGEERGEEKS